MICLRQRTLWESIKRTFSKSYREREDAKLKEAIRELVKNPAAPCMIGGTFVPHGYGQVGQNDYLNEILGRPRPW